MNGETKEQQTAVPGNPIAQGDGRFRRTRKRGLMIIALMITALYWLFDSLVAGQLFTRTIIALAICIYGVLTQFLINSQRSAKQALQAAHRELEQRSLQIEKANKELELAYAWMRDSRDKFRQYLYEEDVAFLLDKTGRVEGVTERALHQTGKSREALLGTPIMDLLPPDSRDNFRQKLFQAWNGVTLHLNVQIANRENPEKLFEVKLTRMTISDKRMLLVILH